MAQQNINFGTLSDGSDGDTTKTAMQKAEANFTELYQTMPPALPSTFISGLKMMWVSTTAVTLKGGAAYIPASNKVIYNSADIVVSGINALPGSVVMHIYAYDNAGVLAAEISSVAPSNPYSGRARTKSGDTSRRYIGSVLTSSTGAIYSFKHCNDDCVRYMTNVIGAPFLFLSNVTNSAPTTVDLSSLVPPTAFQALVHFRNTDTSVAVALGTNDQGYVFSASAASDFIEPASAGTMPLLLDNVQTFLFMFRGTATGNLSCRVIGYYFER